MPTSIIDRAADVWEPLVAIADAARGHWPERARSAAVALNNARAERDPSLGVQLLGDVRRVFAGHDSDRLTTEQLVDALVQLEEAPWADLRGKPIDARGLAKRLRKYDARPGNHRFPDGIKRGYRVEDLHDAWQRYLAPVADVADVVDPQPPRETTADVAVREDEPTYYPITIPGTDSLSVDRKPLHPLQAQQDRDDGSNHGNGHRPALGQPGYVLFLDFALAAGHVTEAEHLEQIKLDALVARAVEAGAA